MRQPAGRDFDPLDPDEERVEVDPHEDPFGLREPDGGGFFTKRKVVIALITGALAFGIAAVVVTAGELTLGGSAAREQSRTTFFGGKRDATPTPTATPAATEDGEEEDATPTPEATEETPTPTPSVQATPAPGEQATPGAEQRRRRPRERPLPAPHARSLGAWPRTGSRPPASRARLG